MAIVAAVFLFVIGVGLLSLGINRRMYSIRSNHQITARCAADYGLTKAVYEMNLRLPAVDNSNLPAENSIPIAGSDATYSYTVTYTPANMEHPYSVQATGTSGSQSKTLLADLRLKGLFEYAILTKSTLDIGSVSTVDCNGCGIVPLKIGTTNNPDAQIILKPNSTINGDILLGQGSNPSVVIGEGATYHNIYAVATDFDLPDPALPTNPDYATYAVNHGTLNLTGASPVTTGNYIYNKIDLKTSGTLNIVGPGDVTIWIRTGIELGNNAEIRIDPNANLTIYLGTPNASGTGDIKYTDAGGIDAFNGSSFNNGGNVKQLSIYVLTPNRIDIKNNGDFCGTIYAPFSDIYMYNDTEVIGSIIANDYTQYNNALFTYDASLRTASIEDAFVRFVPTHWREQ